MTNQELNKSHIKTARNNGKKYYYKRSGECKPEICGGACCRYILSPVFDDNYFMKVYGWLRNPIGIFRIGKKAYTVDNFNCPDFTINARCKNHGTEKQSYICKHFPMVHDDSVYQYVKKFCGYKFEKTLIEKEEVK